MNQPLLKHGLIVHYSDGGKTATLYFGTYRMLVVKQGKDRALYHASPCHEIRHFLAEWALAADRRTFLSIEGSIQALNQILNDFGAAYWHTVIYTFLVNQVPDLSLEKVCQLVGLREVEAMCYLTDSEILVMLDFRKGIAMIQLGSSEMRLSYERERITHKNLAHVLLTYHYIMLGMRR